MSIELPNGKISLTLPEQVGHNARQISKIFQLLDGLNVQDNVVVVADISHVLTAQEITVLHKAVAFIVYGGHLYIKSGESGSNAYFDIVFSITPPGTAITFASSRITANLSNGALSVVNSSVSTYSATQIDTKLGLKADKTYVDSNFATLSGANFTGEITSPSIVETMTGYIFTKTTDNTERTLNYIYAGACKTGNKLTFVINAEIERLDSITSDNVVLGRFQVPNSIGALLYPSTTIGLSNVLQVGTVYAGYSYYQGIEVPFVISKISANIIEIRLYNPNGKLTLNTTYNMRIEATFLLNDNLAS